LSARERTPTGVPPERVNLQDMGPGRGPADQGGPAGSEGGRTGRCEANRTGALGWNETGRTARRAAGLGPTWGKKAARRPGGGSPAGDWSARSLQGAVLPLIQCNGIGGRAGILHGPILPFLDRPGCPRSGRCPWRGPGGLGRPRDTPPDGRGAEGLRGGPWPRPKPGPGPARG